MKIAGSSVVLLLTTSSSNVLAFTTPSPAFGGIHTTSTTVTHNNSKLRMAGGEGGETEWSKALNDNKGRIPGQFDLELAKSLLEKSNRGSDDNDNDANTDSTATNNTDNNTDANTATKKAKMTGLKSQSSSINSKLTANAKLAQWLEEQGDVYLSDASGWGEAPHPMAISTDTVDELTNESSGRGLLARRSVNQEEVLLQIPITLCLTKQSARKQFVDNNYGTILPANINDYLAIACHLIYERFVLNEKSFYKPYLDVLPLVNEVNPTFTWSKEDLDTLKGSPVIAATQSMQMKLKREYQDLLADEGKLCDQFPTMFPKEHFTYQNWEWAFTMLFSRAIRLRNMKQGETLALVPYADLINHSPYSQAYLDARQSGDWLFKTGKEEVVLYADRSYRKMEQIYISYGPKSNAELLLLYGFALERNPFNSVDVTVSIQSLLGKKKKTEEEVTSLNTNMDDLEDVDTVTDPLAEEKLDFLRNVKRDTTVDFPCYADRYPTEMLEYLRLMMMTPEDTRDRQLKDFDYTRTISAANESSVLYSVVQAIQKQLTLYPTMEEQDAAIIKDRGMFRMLSYNQRMAVRHRRNEKRLLKRTIAALEKQIRTRGLDGDNLERAEGSTLGVVLPGEKDTVKQRTALEDRFDRMGLPVDLR